METLLNVTMLVLLLQSESTETLSRIAKWPKGTTALIFEHDTYVVVVLLGIMFNGYVQLGITRDSRSPTSREIHYIMTLMLH